MLQIHWLSIINSMVLVFLLIAFVVVILVSDCLAVHITVICIYCRAVFLVEIEQT